MVGLKLRQVRLLGERHALRFDLAQRGDLLIGRRARFRRTVLCGFRERLFALAREARARAAIARVRAALPRSRILCKTSSRRIGAKS